MIVVGQEWTVTSLALVEPTWQRRYVDVACAKFAGDAEDALTWCPRIQEVCGATATPATCEKALAQRVATQQVEGPNVDLAFARAWPGVADVSPSSRLALVWVGDAWNLTVCVAVATLLATGAREQGTYCEPKPGEWRASEIDGHVTAYPSVPVTLILDAPGSTVTAVAYVRGENGCIASRGSRKVATARVAARADVDVMPRARHITGTNFDVFEVPGVPYASRRAVLSNVAFDGSALLLDASSAPTPLGLLRSGASVGPPVRQVPADVVVCDVVETRPTIAARLIQPVPNQYHFLYTFLSAVLALARREGASLLLLDDTMRASEIFREEAVSPQHATVRAQLRSVFDEAMLWKDYHPNKTVCFDRLFVNADERDALQGYTHATSGLVAPPLLEKAGVATQAGRVSAALRDMRDHLRLHFRVPTPSPRTVLRATIIERRSTRRFASVVAVVDAVDRGCEAAGRRCETSVVALEDLTYEEQIRRLAATDVLVAAEGQGLANVVYLPPSAAVVVIVPPSFEPAVVDYANIVLLLGLRLETTLLLRAPARFGFFYDFAYWSEQNDVLGDLDMRVVAEAVRRALADDADTHASLAPPFADLEPLLFAAFVDVLDVVPDDADDIFGPRANVTKAAEIVGAPESFDIVRVAFPHLISTAFDVLKPSGILLTPHVVPGCALDVRVRASSYTVCRRLS